MIRMFVARGSPCVPWRSRRLPAAADG